MDLFRVLETAQWIQLNGLDHGEKWIKGHQDKDQKWDTFTEVQSIKLDI